MGRGMKQVKIKVSLLTLLVTISLVACNGDINNKTNTSKIDEIDEITDIKELVHEYSVGNYTNESASITSEELIVTKQDGSEITYDLPEDEFFVSIAPFIEATNPCKNHSLTGCQGEMVEKEFDIYIEDTDGNVILDHTMTSYANGFIDLWVPRNKTYHITIEHDGKKVESED